MSRSGKAPVTVVRSGIRRALSCPRSPKRKCRRTDVPGTPHQTGLAQPFNLDLLETAFDAGQFQRVIELNLRLAKQSGHSARWTFSDHDVARQATRYALAAISGDAEHPQRAREAALGCSSTGPRTTCAGTSACVRPAPATLPELAFQGSAYLHQGEEIGVHEVGGVSGGHRQDPACFRSPGVDIGQRDRAERDRLNGMD